jgi:hypothetical protein
MLESITAATIGILSIAFCVFILVAMWIERRNRAKALDAIKRTGICRWVVVQEQLEALIEERDNARIEVCELSSNGSIDDAARHARIRGWGYLYNEQETEEGR